MVANDFGQEVELEALYAEHPHLYSSFRYSSTTDVIGESSTGTVRSCGAQYLDLWRQRIMDEPEVYHSYRGRRRGGTPRGPRGRPPLRNRGGGRAPYLSPSSSAPRRSQVDEWLLENIKSIMRKNSSLLSVSKDIERRGMSYGKRAVGAGVSEGFDSEDEDMDDPESEPAGRASTISASSSASIRTQDELAIFLDDEVDEEQIFSRRRKYTAIKEERATSSQDPSASTSVRSIGTEKPLSMLPKSRSFDTDTPRLRRSQPRKQSSLDDDDQSGVMVSSTTSPKTYGGITSVSGSPPFVPAKRPRGRPRKYPLKPEAKPQVRL